jgi:hypothetical protein
MREVGQDPRARFDAENVATLAALGSTSAADLFAGFKAVPAAADSPTRTNEARVRADRCAGRGGHGTVTSLLAGSVPAAGPEPTTATRRRPARITTSGYTSQPHPVAAARRRPRGGGRVAGGDLFDSREGESTIADNYAPGHDRVPDSRRPAPQPGLHWISQRPGERDAFLRPAHQVPGGTDAEFAYLARPG